MKQIEKEGKKNSTLKILVFFLATSLFALAALLIILERSKETPDTDIAGGGVGATTPWEQAGAKQPEDYTWEEFLKLSPELQIAFQYAFDSADAFEAWMNRVRSTEPETEQKGYPWEQPGAKQPEDYTWEEFMDLSPELQIAFQGAFGSEESFVDWLNRMQPTNPEQSGYPWEQPGAKQPEDYTWEEFMDLPPEFQIAFQFAFRSADGFENSINQQMPKP